MLAAMEESRPSQDELFDRAIGAIEAAAQGKAELAEARAAFLEVAEFRPKGMEPELIPDGPEKSLGDAANTLKMALDAMEGDQRQLALSYVRVARIKLEAAREA